MLKSDVIKNIKLKDETSWKDSVFLTFDVDWAIDDVFSDSIDIVEKYDLSATWFITHKTPLLDRLRENPKFELGIHPNFNKLLIQSDISNGKSANEIIGRLMDIVPEAVSIRSHSLTQSSVLLALFEKFGLSYDCNNLIPASLEYKLFPWELWNGMTCVPYSWEDDIHILYKWKTSMEKHIQQDSLKVFDFHPIHVALNTNSLTRYENSRAYHSDWSTLKKVRWQGDGTRNRLKQLINLIVYDQD
jgi:hypothetical protein